MNLASRVFKGPALSLDAIERDSLWRSKMRYRLGKRFMALDTAGNPCFYYRYKRGALGGWGPITIADLSQPDATKAGGHALLVDRQPMHSKCAPLLEKHLQSLKEKQATADREWCEVLKKRHTDIIEQFDKEEESKASGSSSTTASSSMPTQPSPINYRYEMNRALYARRICRLNRFITYGYKCVYYSAAGAIAFVVLLFYKGFKSWLNPPARQGLNNIEESLFYYPRRVLYWVEDTLYFPFLDFIDAEEDESRPDSVLVSSMRNLLRTVVDGLADVYDALTTMPFSENVGGVRDEQAVIKERHTNAQRASTRLKELLGFLFLLCFVLVIL